MERQRSNSDRDSARLVGIDEDVRHHLVVLIWKGSYDAGFSGTRPTQWELTRVRNPEGSVDGFFTDETAWTFVADRLDQGEDVRVKVMDKPLGRKGYVMKIDIGSDVPRLYIKLELGSGRVWGEASTTTGSVRGSTDHGATVE